MFFALDTRRVDSPVPQYQPGPCQFTNTPPAQTAKTRLSPTQSHSPSRFFRTPQQPALPLGARPSTAGSERATSPHSQYLLSAIPVEKPLKPASQRPNLTQAKIARNFPPNSQTRPITPHKPIEDILCDFNLRGTDSPNPEIHVFSEVSANDFEALVNVVENWYFPERKPKLSHHPASGLLIVEMTTPAHEFAITDFSRAVQPALDSLPINPRHLRITLEPNLLLQSTLTGFFATPDLALVSASTGVRKYRNIFAVVECAFSQDRTNLMEKIRNEVKGWPEILFVVAVFVSEVCDYRSPPADSPTWKYFAQHESVLSSDEFLSLPPSINKSAASSPVEHSPDADDHQPAAFDDADYDDELEPLVLNPIIIAGHMWCGIRDVQYRVWLKKDGILDLDADSATGFLYPNIEMENVDLAINSGLSALKGQIVELAAKTNKSGFASRKLQEADLKVKFNWRAIQSTVKIAAEQTAMSRYIVWFYKSFRGTKRSHSDDGSASYCPSESQSDAGVISLEPRYTLRRKVQ